MVEREFGQNVEAGASSVNSDLGGRIEAAFDDIVQENAHCQPEAGPVDGAFRLERDNSSARIVHGGRAMFLREVGGDAVEVVCTKMHE